MLVALVVGAACSSTNDLDKSQGALAIEAAEGDVSDGGSTVAGDTAVDPGTAAAAPDAVPDAAAGGGSTPTPATGGRTDGGPSAAAPATPGAAAPSADTSPIKVGSYGHSVFAGADFGIGGATLGDPKLLAKIMVDWINDNGGAGGRPFDLVTAEAPVTSEQKSQDDQAACAKFTEDNRVFAATSIVVTTPVFFECMAENNVFYAFDTVYQPDEAYIASHPTVFGGVPSQDRSAAATADALHRAGYFADLGAKVGTVNVDHPWWRSGTAAFKAEAAKHGVKSLVDVEICGFCDSSEASNDAQQGVVKMREAGVTHAVLIGNSSASAFITAAKNANYRPRYGLSSNNTPTLIALTAGPTELQGSVGAGWMPIMDVNAPEEPPQNNQTKLCQKIMNDAGQREDNRLKGVQMRMTCDTFFILKFAFDRAGGATDINKLRAALESAGPAYESAITWKTFFGPGRHDAPAAYRIFAYDTACACFKYTSTEELPFPEVKPG